MLRLALACVLLMTASSSAASAPAPRPCHAVRYDGQQYPVQVLKGGVSCRRARSALRHFFRSGDQKFRGWYCSYGHGNDNWAGTCERGGTLSRPRVIIRAFNPDPCSGPDAICETSG